MSKRGAVVDNPFDENDSNGNKRVVRNGVMKHKASKGDYTALEGLAQPLLN